MNRDYEAIWAAAYAATFVHDFRANSKYSDYDIAKKNTSAETPIDVADAAVNALKRWEREEGECP